MDRRTRRATAALVAVLSVALAGCSGTPAATPDRPAATTAQETTPPPTTPAPSPTPSPTPTALSVEAAGARYLELVAPANAVAGEWNDAYEIQDVAAMRALAQPMADALRTLADGIAATEWPEEAQPAADALILELAAEIAVFVQAAGATSDDAFADALLTMPQSGGAAQLMRMSLGLENVPNT